VNALVLISGLATGGAERVTVSFLRRLADTPIAALACTVTARHDGPLAGELAGAGIPRLDLDARRLADPRALLRLHRILMRERIDVVHAHGQDAAIIGATVRLARPTPLVVTRHVLAEPQRTWRERLRARAALRVFRRADAAVAVSAATADRLAVLTGLDRSAIEVIYNGIDVERFADVPRAPSRAALLTELGVGVGQFDGDAAGDEPLILVPAVLRAGKGHPVMLSALPGILQHVPRARLLFAGAGEQEGALRDAARQLAGHVHFLGSRTDMPALFAAADVVVLPSLGEALPTALIEAAAAGRPCVATAVGGTAEVVEHERTGLLVDAGSAAALASAIVELLCKPEKAWAMGQRARLRARSLFALDRQVAQTVALWERVVAGGRREDAPVVAAASPAPQWIEL
jgi:glycosyltransferase involved in cell wall biosynthesis